MDPVPAEHTFIQNVSRVIFDDFFMELQHKNTAFYQTISDCVKEMYDENQEGYTPKIDSNIDILLVYRKLMTLNNIGAGLTALQNFTLSDLTIYMREYINSQKIATTNKDIPNKYIAQNEDDFIKDTLDFLATLYNMTIDVKKIQNDMRKCVEIFWEHDVTWKRIEKDVTLADIQKLREDLKKIVPEMNKTGTKLVACKFDSLRTYLTDWFHFTEKDKPIEKPTQDINAKVEQLEREIQELRAQVQELLLQNPPKLTTQVLLRQLVRHT